MLLKSVRGFTPTYGENCFIAENATLIGDLVMGQGCSVWYQAVVRGDVNSIRVGDFVNIQDGAVIHATYEKAATLIGNNVSIGSNATILPVFIADNTVIGAGSVVTKSITEPGIYAGNPAKKIKNISIE